MASAPPDDPPEDLNLAWRPLNKSNWTFQELEQLSSYQLAVLLFLKPDELSKEVAKSLWERRRLQSELLGAGEDDGHHGIALEFDYRNPKRLTARQLAAVQFVPDISEAEASLVHLKAELEFLGRVAKRRQISNGAAGPASSSQTLPGAIKRPLPTSSPKIKPLVKAEPTVEPLAALPPPTAAPAPKPAAILPAPTASTSASTSRAAAPAPAPAQSNAVAQRTVSGPAGSSMQARSSHLDNRYRSRSRSRSPGRRRPPSPPYERRYRSPPRRSPPSPDRYRDRPYGDSRYYRERTVSQDYYRGRTPPPRRDLDPYYDRRSLSPPRRDRRDSYADRYYRPRSRSPTPPPRRRTPSYNDLPPSRRPASPPPPSARPRPAFRDSPPLPGSRAKTPDYGPPVVKSPVAPTRPSETAAAPTLTKEPIKASQASAPVETVATTAQSAATTANVNGVAALPAARPRIASASDVKPKAALSYGKAVTANDAKQPTQQPGAADPAMAADLASIKALDLKIRNSAEAFTAQSAATATPAVQPPVVQPPAVNGHVASPSTTASASTIRSKPTAGSSNLSNPVWLAQHLSPELSPERIQEVAQDVVLAETLVRAVKDYVPAHLLLEFPCLYLGNISSSLSREEIIQFLTTRLKVAQPVAILTASLRDKPWIPKAWQKLAENGSQLALIWYENQADFDDALAKHNNKAPASGAERIVGTRFVAVDKFLTDVYVKWSDVQGQHRATLRSKILTALQAEHRLKKDAQRARQQRQQQAKAEKQAQSSPAKPVAGGSAGLFDDMNASMLAHSKAPTTPMSTAAPVNIASTRAQKVAPPRARVPAELATAVPTAPAASLASATSPASARSLAERLDMAPGSGQKRQRAEETSNEASPSLLARMDLQDRISDASKRQRVD